MFSNPASPTWASSARAVFSADSLAAPLLCGLVDFNQRALFGRYEIGLELLLLNGAITFALLWLASRPGDQGFAPNPGSMRTSAVARNEGSVATQTQTKNPR